MRRALVAVVAAVLAAVVGGVMSLPEVAGAQTAPTIKLSLDAATIGQPVVVAGEGFPATTSVSVQLCGDSAARGSTDCDVVAGQTVVTNEVGAFQSQIVARYPPVPCPCVVWASSNGAAAVTATAPIGVVTAPFTNPAPAPTPAADTATPGIEVVRASIRPTQQWRSWLGLPTTDELVLTLRNNTDAPMDHPLLSLTVGKGTDPTRVIPSPDLGHIEPGAEQTVVVPFPVDALSWGRLTVKGTLGSATPVVFRTHVWAVPWLPFVALALTIALVVLVRRRRRRRVPAAAPTESSAEADIVVEAEPEPEPEPDLDLSPELDDEDDAEPVPVVGVVSAALAPEVVAPAPAVAPGVRVTFTWPIWLRARSVSLSGEFNDWSTDAHPLERLENGDWAVTLELEPGRTYRYKFFVDGERWENDWVPDDFVPNEFGSEDSVVVVGCEDRYANLAEQHVPRANGDRGGLDVDLTGGDDDVVDLTALDELAPLNEDFWAEERQRLRLKLRRHR